MFNLNFKNIIISIFIKTLIFYIILMISNNDFRILQLSNVKNGLDLFYFLWILLFFPIIDIILFSVPLFYVFRIKNYLYFFAIFLVIMSAEYFIYAYFTSQKAINQDASLKVLVSFMTLFLFFYKRIKLPRHIKNFYV